MCDSKNFAKIVNPTLENLIEAGNKIKNGGLVAFPTETVYGLGANALDKDAVLSIFKAKGRPLTDPVIVHIIESEYALKLLKLTEKQKEIFQVLSDNFWPGPLTIVAKSSELIPMIVTAETGYVGVRFPNHPLAQQLIKHSGKPIAAPSANRFGHVSPTTANHVLDDLADSPITILNSINNNSSCDNKDIDDNNNNTKEEEEACKIGIESTVLKIVSDSELVILRRGGVSEKSLKCVINNKFKDTIQITSINKTVENTTSQGQEAPGQLLTHYAPDIQTFILDNILNSENDNNNNNNKNNDNSLDLKECVYIDFGNQLPNEFKNQCLAYRDLSENKNILEAANQLFAVLRWSENQEGAKIILLPDLRKEPFKSLDNSEAVFDRIFRAASGKQANLSTFNKKVLF
ncbi:hypothetical protein DDB_G0278955 [Dictyostelium discoideum AX4]|uniref:Threonylcarbamoyl-AMP synthase n=1 Tax=Dictyostelium discoideum TaxID=44689 RepID=Q54XJ3_DICDI|nr:hypothetical protein DDB_G0278955 [Dictyostelium discoideum AX4]EAL68079.1 hypothetical protein DDB_G0278955 [Dictyostelium discoideum AX4]|eukprot:XP_647810.1 hypothetical protein DDB_G0278955 [Dictyostelium discoideum AX4]